MSTSAAPALPWRWLRQLPHVALLLAMAGAGARADAPPRAGAPADTKQADNGISQAEILLFQTRHLRNVPPSSELLYAFHKEGGPEPGFDDEVRLRRNANKGTTVHFLSGPRQQPTPAVDDPEGNPVLLAFLEHDIADMHRLTGGSVSYFRKRLRLALAQSAQVSARRFVYLGRAVDGREVSIEPYRDDPMHARFEAYTGKRYSFLLSPNVPGGIYQLRTVVPALVDETLTLVGVEPARR